MRARDPLVVLVHGFLGEPHDWEPMRGALASAGMSDVMAVDMLDCARRQGCADALARAAHLDPEALAGAHGAAALPVGGREHADAAMRVRVPSDTPFEATSQGDGLDALACALESHIDDAASAATRDGRPIVLCGYSLGGRVCLALAGRAQAAAGHARAGGAREMAAFIVIGADPGIDELRERSLRAGRDHAHATHLLSDPDGFIAAWYAQPLFASLRASPEFDRVVARRRAGLSRRSSREMWAQILDACSPGRCAPRWGVAAQCGHRLAFVHGALDDKFSAIARRIHACAPDVPTISIPGAGHAAHVEQPQACADAVASIIAASVPHRT